MTTEKDLPASDFITIDDSLSPKTEKLTSKDEFKPENCSTPKELSPKKKLGGSLSKRREFVQKNSWKVHCAKGNKIIILISERQEIQGENNSISAEAVAIPIKKKSPKIGSLKKHQQSYCTIDLVAEFQALNPMSMNV